MKGLRGCGAEGLNRQGAEGLTIWGGGGLRRPGADDPLGGSARKGQRARSCEGWDRVLGAMWTRVLGAHPHAPTLNLVHRTLTW